MSSLVSDYIINPVTRTVVRRFSSPFSAGPSLESRHPFSRGDYPEENGNAIAECDAPSPFPSLGRFTRTPDIALGARSPPLLIPQVRRGVTAPVTDELSRPLTVPSIAPLRLEMERHDLSDTGSTAEPDRVIDASAQAERDSRRLPADDGMQEMRRQIHSIQNSNITVDQKRFLTQQLHTKKYNSARQAKTVAEGKAAMPVPPTQDGSASTTQNNTGFGSAALETLKSWTGLEERARLYVSEQDRQPTYVPATAVLDDDDDLEDDAGKSDDVEGAETRVLGCLHYRRNVKLQCASCEKWYTCRLCHDEAEEHILPRTETKYMLCMLCGHAQKASDTCVNCSKAAAQYYCNVCKLWSDDVNKPIYHCDECGICRVGHGLDKDFFHCKVY